MIVISPSKPFRIRASSWNEMGKDDTVGRTSTGANIQGLLFSINSFSIELGKSPEESPLIIRRFIWVRYIQKHAL
jgi:hypothetical protein